MPEKEPASLEAIQAKLDGHIDRHNEDYKKLLWWIIGTLITVVSLTAERHLAAGKLEEKVAQLEEKTANNVSRQEWEGSIELIAEKFDNLDEKVDDIKEALRIK